MALRRPLVLDASGFPTEIPSGDAWRDISPINALANVAGVVNIDCSLGNFFTLALAANVTSITFSNLPAAGLAQSIMVAITQDPATARTVAFPAAFDWPGGTVGVVSTGLSAVDLLGISTFNQGTTWLANLAKAYA